MHLLPGLELAVLGLIVWIVGELPYRNILMSLYNTAKGGMAIFKWSAPAPRSLSLLEAPDGQENKGQGRGPAHPSASPPGAQVARKPSPILRTGRQNIP